MKTSDILTRYENYVAKTKSESTANSYKNSIKCTLEFFGYGEDISLGDMREIKDKHEDLGREFRKNEPAIIKNLESAFSEAKSYLEKGFVRASLAPFVEFLSDFINSSEASEFMRPPNKKASNKRISEAEFLKWFEPIIQALKDLGGAATPKATRKQIVKNLNLPDSAISETRGKTKTNKFNNEVQFARQYLVSEGIIDKSTYGLWTLTEKGKNTTMTREYASEIFRKWVKIFGERRKNENTERETSERRIWIYAPGDGARKWEEFYSHCIMGIGWDELGDLSQYPTKESVREKMKAIYDETKSHKNNSLAAWQFFNTMREGDIVFAKKGLHEIIGCGIVESDYMFMPKRDEYRHIRNVKWTHRGNWTHPGQAVSKTLTDISAYTEYVQKLELLVAGDGDVEELAPEMEIKYAKYTATDFLSEVFMDAVQYDTLVRILTKKKNLILQGVPGVGKTFAAKRLAYSMIGEKDTRRVMMVQFHQSYSYEDFIMGFRPTKEGGFKPEPGPFYTFCKNAGDDLERDYFFIIDEINRGNFSKIFGELLMLIENDKRSEKLRLLYSNELFSVPRNVYIIGLMNTADRSLAVVDYALRRRFAFFELTPGFESDGFTVMVDASGHLGYAALVERVKELNEAISEDESLGDGFKIGHSYFCCDDDVTDDWLADVIDFEILPLLNEYWFDEKSKVKTWTTKLHGVLND